MNPICFHVLGRPIYWYGVMTALGFLLGTINWHLILRREKRHPEFAADMGFWIMVSGIAGARIAYIIANISEFVDAPAAVFRVDQGGLIFYGGFIGAVIAVVLLARKKKEPLLPFADLTITALPLGHAAGRIGCFINGCCYGNISTAPWAVYLNEATRHPVQLYEAALNFCIYLVLLKTYFSKNRDGFVFAVYLTAYSLARFVLEFFRGDERAGFFFFSYAQWFSVIFFIIGILLVARLPDNRLRQNRCP